MHLFELSHMKHGTCAGIYTYKIFITISAKFKSYKNKLFFLITLLGAHI